MQDISCLVLPIPAHAFFKQAVLQGEIGHHLLQGGGFTTKVLHLAGRRGAGGVARQPALAGLQELLRPAVIHRGGDAFPAAQLRDVLLATQSFQHNADLLFGRILLPRRPADVADKLLGRTSGGNGFLSHLRSLAATMSQKSSVPQAAKFVSQALKRDTRDQHRMHTLLISSDKDSQQACDWLPCRRQPGSKPTSSCPACAMYSCTIRQGTRSKPLAALK